MSKLPQNEPMFVMSMYANKEELYKAKAEHYQKRFEELWNNINWALRANRSGMVGFVPSLLHGQLEDLDYQFSEKYTLRQFIEATEKEDDSST